MADSAPKVSVILTTRNRATLLRRAVKSVLGQTYVDFELLIVDDASTDSTADAVEAFKDERIRYIRRTVAGGGSAARNTGIEAAAGEYIAFLDDDDEWFPGKLEKQVSVMEKAPEDVGLVYTGVEIDGKGWNRGIERVMPVFKGDLRERLLRGSTIGSVSKVLARKECFFRAGMFDENLKSCQDWDMWLRIADFYRFDFVPEILARIHLHGEQISSNLGSMIPGRIMMVEKHMDRFRERPEILVIHLKRIGKLYCISGRWKEALRWFGRAVGVLPLEIFKIAAWCLFGLPGARRFARRSGFERY